MLGSTKQRQFEKRIGKGRLHLRREHTGGDSRGAGGQVAALQHRDARTGQRQVVGDGAANDPAANDDDVRAGADGRCGQRPAPTRPVIGLDGIATSLRGIRPAR